MIKSWANRATQRFASGGKGAFSGMDEEAARDMLAALDAALALRDLSPLKSVGLHKLRGGRRAQWAMTINGPWRLCFRFANGDAWDVEIVDYH
jgi:proteic killer suppression protein